MSDIPDLAVTRHPPIRDQIASILRTAIINLDFKPGQVLIERELCERTGASRPSVREALRQLEAEGLVESKNGRGTVVRTLTATEIENVYEIRAELEGLGARLFSERASDRDRTELKDALDQLRDATSEGLGQSAGILTAQSRFYGVLFTGAANPLLEQLVQGLQVRVSQLRATTLLAPGRAEESLAEFEQIVRAIEMNDPMAAEQAAVVHVRRAAEVMRSVEESRGR
jgi:DNA-binding GntR family transcriptional regulator